MGSSELSDALNPYFSQSKIKNSFPVSQPVSHQSSPPTQLIHHPQFQAAVIDVQQQHSPAVRSRPSPVGNYSAVQELLRLVSSTKEAHEAECQRRILWEQEHELKSSQREAALEKEVQELREELNILRQYITSNSPAPSSIRSIGPSLAQLSASVSPIMQHEHVNISQPSFIQGSSSFPIQNAHPFAAETHQSTTEHYQQHLTANEQHSMPTGSFESPRLAHNPTPLSRSEASRSPPPDKSTKRRKVQTSSSSELSGSSDSDSGTVSRLSRRRNHHDKRIITIHQALRAHIIRVMGLENDKNLPDSHPEGMPLESSQPVRFVWDKTTKQSVHNARMKTRILEDVKKNRKDYKAVPDREFSKKTMDAAFDQCFTTLRQKFKGQRDKDVAEHEKARGEYKTLKARRLARKKAKLESRSDTRVRLPAFEHSTFDGAFDLECMSSEESENEQEPSPNQARYLITHGWPWRSSRLLKFYEVLDDDGRAGGAKKQKRGVGKLERVTGELKQGFQLPPKGVASWMVSRRWIREEMQRHPDLHDALAKIIQDPPLLDWAHIQELGGESEDEQPQQQHHQVQPMMEMHQMHMPPQQYDGSLQYAFP
ncbi:hypothetical protein VNI00_001261 [Paramarasmius palmivorus]|uniref:Uncharacterized protein n=1 Tax=Paramarasmius palmivorus TaxID=297713 RepID=A0AAW0E9A1_9AGAR